MPRRGYRTERVIVHWSLGVSVLAFVVTAWAAVVVVPGKKRKLCGGGVLTVVGRSLKGSVRHGGKH